MYGLSLGVQRMNEILPSPVYALLSGLNASTVGIIALAAVQLAEKAIKDNITRILVIFGACAGVCYNALWYFPILMIIGGLTTFLWDGHLKLHIVKYKARRRRQSSPDGYTEHTAVDNAVPLEETSSPPNVVQRRTNALSSEQSGPRESSIHRLSEAPAEKDHTIRIRVGVPLIITFFGKHSYRVPTSTELNVLDSFLYRGSSCTWSATAITT